MSVAVALFSILSSIASTAAAVAAFAALKRWRRQITGVSQHDVAKRLWAALRQVSIERAATLNILKAMGGIGINGELARFFAPNWMRGAVPKLEAAVSALAQLEGEVDVHWGDGMLGLVELVRNESSLLAAHANAAVSPGATETFRGYLATFPTQSGLAPSFTGRAFDKALDLYTTLAQTFLAIHLEREGAKVMSLAELKAKRADLDKEVERLVEPERSQYEKEHAKWVAEHGGPQGVLEFLRGREAAETGNSQK